MNLRQVAMTIWLKNYSSMTVDRTVFRHF